MISTTTWRIFTSFNVLGLIFLCSNLYGQSSDVLNGYYFTTTGDSIYGQFHIGELKQSILKYRKSDSYKWEILSVEKLAKAKFENGQIIYPQEVSFSDKSKYILIAEIVSGPYTLYRGYSELGTSIFFAKIPESNIVKINPFGYKQQLITLLGACAKNIHFSKVKYNLVSLSRVFIKANDCLSPKSAVVSKHYKLKPRFAIGAGLVYYNLHPGLKNEYEYEPYFSQNYEPLNRFSGLVSIKLNINKIFSFSIGAVYVDKHMIGDTVYNRFSFIRDVPGVPPTKTYDYFRFNSNLNFSYIEFPVGLNVNLFPKAKVTPFISFGTTPKISIKSEMESEWGCPKGRQCNSDKIDPERFAPTGAAFDRDPNFEFFTGLGIKRSQNKKGDFEIRFDYFNQSEKASINTNNASPNLLTTHMKTSRFQISASYFFYLN